MFHFSTTGKKQAKSTDKYFHDICVKQKEL